MIALNRTGLRITSFLLFFSTSITTLAADNLILNTTALPPYALENQQGFLDLLVKDAFSRMGKTAEVHALKASGRAIELANEGTDDGVAQRTRGLEKKFTSLIRVDEPINTYEFVAFTLNPDISTPNWGALAPYRKAHIRGWKVLERNLKGQSDIDLVNTADQLFKMLLENRVDLVLFEKWQGLKLARDLDIKVIVAEPALLKADQFIYLHKKHRDLVEPLAESLREMKKDGRFDAIFNETLRKIIIN